MTSTALVLVLIFASAALLVSRSPAGAAAGSVFSWLLAGNPPNATWYVTRAAGLTAFLLLWLSTLWGLGISTRILNGRLHGSYTMDFHQVVSLLALGFTAVHMFILLFDKFSPFTLAQVLVPLKSDYRPVWVGLGILSMYISVLVTVTFYLRRQIGGQAFRIIHLLSLLGFFGAALHGLLSGTDSGLATLQVLYAASSASVVFLLVYWIADRALQARKPLPAASQPPRRSPAQSAGD